ncbi:MAG: hypothetical protein KAW84_04405 [Thermoplasmata archaeon]|nr:hypothetical protein [Thermoplasmata archaeon]
MDVVLILLAVVFFLIGFFIPMIFCPRRFVRVPPDKAMVVYGKRYARGKGFRVVTRMAKFAWPSLTFLLPSACICEQHNCGGVKYDSGQRSKSWQGDSITLDGLF